uniref:hypothetical protein n=1 Tax=Flavobacterium sp. TaxID=239 RepID=UPI004049A784
MTHILQNKQIAHPIFIILVIGFTDLLTFDVFNLMEIWDKGFYEIADFIFRFLIVVSVFSLFNMSKTVALQNDEIITGIYTHMFGFLKMNNRMKISDIDSFEIKQNEKYFFEILAISKNTIPFVIASIPNKIPAENELIRIQNEIKIFTSKTRLQYRN